jgi:ABC-type Co2+ transport system permease subunit
MTATPLFTAAISESPVRIWAVVWLTPCIPEMRMIAIILVSGIQGVNQTTAQILTGLSLIAAVNMGVAVIEALFTGLMVAYIGKVRPDILEGTLK